jgi:hypothetical protein
MCGKSDLRMEIDQGRNSIPGGVTREDDDEEDMGESGMELFGREV